MQKSKLQNNEKICYLCGRLITNDSNLHHIFNGAYRDKSDKDGMVVYLHSACHRKLHDHYEISLKVKKAGQIKWEEIYGTREEFIKKYGKSYL